MSPRVSASGGPGPFDGHDRHVLPSFEAACCGLFCWGCSLSPLKPHSVVLGLLARPGRAESHTASLTYHPPCICCPLAPSSSPVAHECWKMWSGELALVHG